ncbi:hypothetical protein OAH34_02790, partial [bacterium]|nr:hypothetical protein [bacterium]
VGHPSQLAIPRSWPFLAVGHSGEVWRWYSKKRLQSAGGRITSQLADGLPRAFVKARRGQLSLSAGCLEDRYDGWRWGSGAQRVYQFINPLDAIEELTSKVLQVTLGCPIIVRRVDMARYGVLIWVGIGQSNFCSFVLDHSGQHAGSAGGISPITPVWVRRRLISFWNSGIIGSETAVPIMENSR